MYNIKQEEKIALSEPTYAKVLNNSNHKKLFKKTAKYRIVCVRTNLNRFMALSLAPPPKLCRDDCFVCSFTDKNNKTVQVIAIPLVTMVVDVLTVERIADREKESVSVQCHPFRLTNTPYTKRNTYGLVPHEYIHLLYNRWGTSQRHKNELRLD